MSMFPKFTIDRRVGEKPIQEILNYPTAIYVNEFTEDSLKGFAEQWSQAQNSDQDVIPIIIDSFGGVVYSLFGMIDIIKKSDRPVATICIGKAMSCGAGLLCAGTEGYRYASENSFIMIHDVSQMLGGSLFELENGIKHTKAVGKKLFEVMARNVGHADPNYFRNLYKENSYADLYMTAREALSHKIINHIGIPTMETVVEARTVLK
jgi:ATP-dependent Clp protease protease subunit